MILKPIDLGFFYEILTKCKKLALFLLIHTGVYAISDGEFIQ